MMTRGTSPINARQVSTVYRLSSAAAADRQLFAYHAKGWAIIERYME